MGGEKRSHWAALAMFAVILLTYVINAMDRQLFSVLAPDVRGALGLTIPEVGLASTVFTLGMGLAGIPTGYLLQRMSRKSVALLGLAVFSVATLMTAYANGLADLMVYRFVSGLGEAMQLTAILAIGTTYFVNNRALAASSLIFAYGIGAIIGPNVGAAILGAFDWRMPFIVFGLLGLPGGLLIAICVRGWFSEAKGDRHQSIDSEPLDETIWSFRPMMLAGATAFAGLAIYGYLGLYPTFLREALGFAPRDAALAVSFYGLGAMLASLAGGWAGDRFDFRKVLLVSLAISAVSGALLFTELNRSLFLHLAMSLVFGTCISGIVYTNLSAGMVKSVSRRHAGQASGLFVASLYIPAAFAGYLVGVGKDAFGWSAAGALQIAGCAMLSAAITLLVGRRGDVSLSKKNPTSDDARHDVPIR